MINNEIINIKDMYLFEENPRYSFTRNSKEKLNKIQYDDLTIGSQLDIAKKLLSHEGNYLDLLLLINSIIKNGFKERSNIFIFMMIKSDDNHIKYIVTDGNRRLLALKMINCDFEFRDLFTDDDLQNVNVKNIQKHIYDFNSSDKNVSIIPENFTHSYSFEKDEIEEMFEDINFNHTGSTSNGKRDWSRGKMLEEMYLIYSESKDIQSAVKKISSEMLLSETKSKNDLRHAVWFVEMLDIYNSLNEDNKINPIKIAPSSVELILTVKLPKEIIDHEYNASEIDNLSKLFGIKILANKKTKKYNISVSNENISKDALSSLIFKGYKISKNNNNLEEELEFGDDIFRENKENSGLKTNAFFSTRSWKKEGIKELLDILDWPKGRNKNEKIEQITEDNEKLFNLTDEEIDYFIEKSSIYLENDPDLLELFTLLHKTPSLISRPLYSTIDFDNHIYSVILLTLENEYSKLQKMSVKKGSRKPYSLQKKHIISQLAVIRSISELTQLLLIYTFINIYYEYDKNNAKKNFNLYFLEAVKIGPNGIPLIDDPFDVFAKLFLKNDYSDLSIIFEKLRDNFSGLPHKNFSKLNKFISNTIIHDTGISVDWKEYLIEFQKEIGHMDRLTANIGTKISVPLHYFSKFINEKDKKSLVILNSMFIEIYNHQISFLKYLNKNSKNIFRDSDMVKILNDLL